MPDRQSRPTTTPVRLAVIGAGLVGRKHAKLIAQLPGCTLAGICDVEPARQPVAEACRTHFYSRIERLLEDQKPEGAIIATPNATHAELAERCAERCVHVLIEKPIAESLAQAQRIIEAATGSGIRVLVGHHRRHNPLIREARRIVQSGQLGRLIGVNILWALTKPTDYFHVDWRCRRPGGGPTFINLIHELDSLRFICGEIRQLYAQSSSAARRLEVEDSIAMTVTFDSGAIGSILASDAAASAWSYEANTGENRTYFHVKENCYWFLGTAGSLAFPQMVRWHYEAGQPAGWQHPMTRSIHRVEHLDPLVLQLEHFCRVVRGLEEPLIDAADGTRSLAVALAALASAQGQVPVAPTVTAGPGGC